MKNYIILLIITLFSINTMAQQKQTKKTEYDNLWDKVEKYTTKNATADALIAVENIVSLAKKENNIPEKIKAISTQIKLQSYAKPINNTFEKLQAQLPTAQPVEKEIWYSYIAEEYVRYYNDNKWEILERTKLEKPSTKITEWTADQFFEEAFKHYNKSIAPEKLLQNTKNSDFRSVVSEGTNTDDIYKTLYEVLLDRALIFYANDEIELTKPAYAFTINGAEGFADVQSFLKSKIITSDTTSSKYNALQMYKKLLNYYTATNNANGLIDADSRRLGYVYNHCNAPNKKQLYIDALQKIADKYSDNKYGANAQLTIAELTQNDVQEQDYFSYEYNEQPIKKEAINKRLLAINICEKIQKKFSDKLIQARCKTLLAEMQTQNLKLNIESNIVPNKNILANICYRNISKVYCYILPNKTNEDYDRQENITRIKNIQPIIFDLPNATDKLNHSTDVKLNGLPSGTYNIIITNTTNLSDKKILACFAKVQVTNIAFIHVKQQNMVLDKLVIVDRISGAPIPNTSIEFYVENYNNNLHKSERLLKSTEKTDANGMLDVSNNYDNTYFVIKNGTDKYSNQNSLNVFNNYEMQNISENRMHLFTDRNIYRPNQTIYFKGIYTQRSNTESVNKTTVLANQQTTIKLNDANGQTIDSVKLTTNEFGSISGSFTIPQGLLSGGFSLVHTNGFASIQVEEYKRPKFEIIADTLTTALKLNEKIIASGTAKAYAGNAITDAKVVYSVVRKTRFIYDWCRWFGGKNRNEQMAIANGETSTDVNGKYSFAFIAIPNDEDDKSTYPVFDYTITTTIIDINGETHDDISTISVGYQAVQLQADVPAKSIAQDLKTILIFTKNMNNNFVPCNVELNCYELQTPTSIKIDKKWAKPDQYIMSKIEFEKNFANDEYADESDMKNWAKTATLFTKNITSTADGIVQINEMPNKDAIYLIEIKTIDKSGDVLTEKKYIRVFKNQNAQPIGNETMLITKAEKDFAYNISTTPNIKNVLNATIYNYTTTSIDWAKQNGLNGIIQLSPKSTENTLSVNLAYYYNNKYYNENILLAPTKIKKDFAINITTFRDKLSPNSEQKWAIQLSGSDANAINAELLTSMYDASLDDLYKGDWENFASEEANTFVDYRGIIFEHSNENIEQMQDITLYEFKKNQDGNFYDELISFINENEGKISYAFNEINVTSRAMPTIKKSFAVADASAPMKKDNEQDDNQKQSVPATKNNPPSIRTNLQETAFWFPQLSTNANGEVSFTFTSPEALTKWRWRILAHNKNVQSAITEKTITTSKELMVVTNNTRFYRAGDQAIYTSKIVNTSTQIISGESVLSIENAITLQSENTKFGNTKNTIAFTLQPYESVSIPYSITIPANATEPIIIKLVATAKSSNGNTYSDGEQNMVPILSNNLLVTESKSFAVRGGQTKQISIENLLNADASQAHHNYAIEYTNNPVWYAVQSLPYMAEFPYECAEQTFTKFYANQISAHIIKSNPTIASMITTWKNNKSDALISNLEKNQELKSVLLQESPWLVQAKTETEQKQHLEKLLDAKQNEINCKKMYEKLAKMQTAEGGFAWFDGMRADQYITQYILTGFGKLIKLNIIKESELVAKYPAFIKALNYSDREIIKRYNAITKATAKNKKIMYSPYEIQYLYMRSFFKNVDGNTQNAIKYYVANLAKNVFAQSLQMQAMGAIVLHRNNQKQMAMDVVKGLQQNAISNDDEGMYWKNNKAGYNWHQAPIETQCAIIECFEEINADAKTIDELKIWLLKNKQTNNWHTTKATADAVYALLMHGSNFMAKDAKINITGVDMQMFNQEKETESGTGYTKLNIDKSKISQKNGSVTITNSNANSPLAWGGVHYQYFQNLDKIKPSNGDIGIEKTMMIVTNTSTGEVLKPITNTGLSAGQKVRIRIVLSIKQNMDYVHLKDMRGACFEPLNVVSSYKYNNGLGYYESTKDVATHFFFDHINKGTYVFEYDLFATNKGAYSNGIANIECMYAPEFSGHSEGVKVQVK